MNRDSSGEVSRAERLARAEADLDNLNQKLVAMQADIREVRDALREMHGGWKTILAMLAVAGSAGTLAAALWGKITNG